MSKRKLEDFGFEALEHLSEDRNLLRSKESDHAEIRLGAVNANATARSIDSVLRVKKYRTAITAAAR